MKISGIVKNLIEDERLFTVKGDVDIIVHTTHKELKTYIAYLGMEPFVDVEVSDTSKPYKLAKGEVEVHELDHFNLIKKTIEGEDIYYYDIEDIRRQTVNFLSKLDYKMFLDLEFSWPAPYTNMPSEIVQYGYIITDKDDKIVEQGSSLVKPSRRSQLNKKTLKFLSRELEEFDDAKSYISFYQLLAKLLKKYDAKIIAWGRNDMLEIESSYKINHLAPLDTKQRFINLMQLIKNYYCYKTEMGLFNTYKELANVDYHEQTHDALEDAMLTFEIFKLFKEKISK